ncbi:cytoplasmic dynein 2 light intermediate chain 1 [Phlebotomus argentipes]|uniref:cytoplasmic dynein 2 light intermediate chain 1 n=1 Tax=Phlebotomus argentipes TaxID=94469 RepID=UPI002892D7D0|nr:cytoplasmic dynein 2 light intermediate chain 1 [Phlebotomus argentipes]
METLQHNNILVIEFEKMSDIQRETLQEITIKLAEDQLRSQTTLIGPRERTTFILGSKNVGKSSIINRYLDRDESPKATLALEYSYGRRSSPGQGIQKQVCHVWELGTVVNSEHLLSIPFRSHDIEHVSVIIVMDLSRPEALWNDLQSVVLGLKSAFGDSVTRDRAKELKTLREVDHKDASTLDLFPVPVFIIGGKYDMFQDKDPEIKKQVCRCLRATAHLIGASLFFYSMHNSAMGKTLRDILNRCGFGSPANPIRNFMVDYNGPLSVSFEQDSWDAIGIPPKSLEAIGSLYCSAIPQEDNSVPPLPPDPVKDADFREPIIDELRAQRDEEFQTLLKHSDLTGMFEKIV